MSQKIRKILFIVFILIFLIVSPAVIFYASGYKLNWDNPLSFYFIQKTGMLIVESDPSEAEIFLNGKKQKDLSLNLKIFKGGETTKTPAKIKNLLPGSYDLRVEREGYQPWERRIKISPGQITHVLDIKLFKEESPVLISQSQDEKIKFSPNRKKIILLPSVKIFETKNEEFLAPTSLPQENIYWSEDGGKIITSEEIINLKSSEKYISLTNILGNDFSMAKWGRSNEEIIYLFKDKLSIFNLQNNTAKLILSNKQIEDFTVKKNQVAVISLLDSETELKIFNPEKNNETLNIKLPYSQDYSFVNEDSELLNILDRRHSRLYLIEPTTGEIKEALENCDNSSWFNSDIIFCANDFEIRQFDIKQKDDRLLTRISKNKITDLATTDTDNYILYFTDKTINVLTWDKGEDTIQTTELLILEKITSPIFDTDSGLIYFLGEIEQQKGLYKLEIR